MGEYSVEVKPAAQKELEVLSNETLARGLHYRRRIEAREHHACCASPRGLRQVTGGAIVAVYRLQCIGRADSPFTTTGEFR